MTLSQMYRRDRDAEGGKRGREKVWRQYAFAVMAECTHPRRCLLNIELNYRRADGDADLAVRYEPYWQAKSDEEIWNLYDALCLKRDA